MNSVHEQLPQTMTANSALNQNWVGCIVRTPITQVARTLRAQCSGRGLYCAHARLVARRRAQVARMLGMRWSQHAEAACPRSRPQNGVATSFPLPNPRLGRDFLSGSGPPGRPSQVVTPTPCRDLPSAQPN